MINIRYFTIQFLLLSLFNTTIFGMEQAPLHALAAAFHPKNQHVALLCSDLSLKIWDRNNMTKQDISLASIKTEFDNHNIHSIKYDHDDVNHLLITLYTPSGRECLGFEDLVTAKTLTFNITTAQCEQSVVIKDFAQNRRANNAVHILKSALTIIGYKEDKRLSNEIVKKIQSYALHPNDNNPIVAAGFDNETHLHNLATWEPFHILKHAGTHSTTLNFSPDGKQLVIGKSNGSIDFYSLKTTLYTPTENKPEIEQLELIQQESININQERLEVERLEKERLEKEKSQIWNRITTAITNPLSTLNALWHNTTFTTKTITTLAGLGALWLCYTKYITAKG
jgi:WD40 repeat protein